MNKGTDLRVSRSLELLKSIKKTGADFSAQEEQLSHELGARRFSIHRAFREAMQDAEARHASQAAAIQTHFQAAEQSATAVYESRRDRVEKFYNDSIRELPFRAQHAKEAWMGNLQMRDFQAQTQRTADMEAAAAAYGREMADLAQERTALAILERRARRYFLGYWNFLQILKTAAATDPIPEHAALIPALRERLVEAETRLAAFRRSPLPLIFSYAPMPVLVLLFLGGSVPFGWVAFALGAVFTALTVAAHFSGGSQARPAAQAVAASLATARQLGAEGEVLARAAYDRQLEAIQEAYEETHRELSAQWNRADTIEVDFANSTQEKLDAQAPRATAKNEEMFERRLRELGVQRDVQLHAIAEEVETQKRLSTENHDVAMAEWTANEKRCWEELQTRWKLQITPLFETLEALNATASAWFPAWTPELAANWTPPTHFIPAVKFGKIEADLAARPGSVPKDPRLALPGNPQITLPLALAFPTEGSLLFETKGAASETLTGALNQIILRLLSTTPPGKISFTIIDPVGLGENFAGLMQLSDYEESLINRRIWTQRDQIEERLGELCEHIEKVIQMYLRNQYATITEYNEQAGSVAEKYHFLVVADFPAAFSETAAARLQSIATSGARCGVFTLLHWDRQPSLPDGFVADELRNNSVRIRQEQEQLHLNQEQPEEGVRFVLDAPPSPELAMELTHKIGKNSIDSNRVEVPFEQIAPAPEEMWKNETTQELRIAIGRTGATKQQYLAIGKGTRQHALFAGKTGSGKSTLFHVIITNLALACSPTQVEFYLIDFKKGVEFKCYAEKRLPHAKVVAIESDREFALSVLERVDEELKRRGDLFRGLGVQDIAGYKRAGGTEPIPRCLLIIDEFQEFFVEDDSIAQTASLLLDRIVRQGRAFGIHVLLGSQTLGGAYSLARATLGQMAIRVALQCNEADAYLIMDENNPAPRLLSRPGEGIYNDSAGAMEGNSPFQVVWLPDEERDQWLDKIQALTKQYPGAYSSPIVFEGNAPADIGENTILSDHLTTRPAAAPPIARAWLGAPNAIKGPTEAAFRPQSGSNLLIIGQRDEAVLTMLGLSMLALSAQYPVGAARFVLFHTTVQGTPDGDFLESILKAIPHPIAAVRGADVSEAMNDIAAELKSRSSGNENAALPVFCFIHGLQKFKKLRQEDEFAFSMSDADSAPNPGAQFNEIIHEGASHGIHLILTLDTFNNVNRFLSRKALSEFEMRVVFQMSASDSASLIDSPKASALGLHRALFYNEHEGTLETFRPYAMPGAEWIKAAGKVG